MQRVSPGPSLQQMLSNPPRRKPIAPNPQRFGETKEKFMRLRGKIRILHNSYLQSGEIADRDADVAFVCSDGTARAHKVILVTVSPFFNDLFQGQKAGSMSHVIIPDISLATMKTILLLAYRDNLLLTNKQMKDVAVFLPLFGMDLKNFIFDETNLAEQTGGVVPPSQQHQQNRRPPPPMTVRPNPPPLQQAATHRQIGSITISGTGRLAQPVAAGLGNRTSSGEEGDFKMFQGYDTLPPPLKQIRLTSSPQGLAQVQMKKPKPTVNIGNFRRIAPKPPADPLPIRPAMNMTIGNQEIQFDDNDDDDGQVLDPEQGRLMVQEWMQNVSGSDNETTVNRGGSASISSQAPKNQCLICNNVFENPEKWRWHESHHVGLGIFKCAYCDELFSTSRKVYQHEMMEHGVSGSNASLDDPPPIPSDFQIVQGRKRKFNDEGNQNEEQLPRMTLVRTANGTHYRRIPTTAPLSKKLLSKYSNSKRSSGGVEARAINPNIGIGIAEGEELIDDRKIKQLHWVYVCNKCQYVSDSLGKAQKHYEKCYQDKSEIFEKSVMKYRQGFFGRFRCPLCPRRYTTNHGFTIHAGHMHNDFRRKFQHINQNDKIACVGCRQRFDSPSDFHLHLGDDGECNAAPVYSVNDKSTKWIGNETPGEKKNSSGSPSRKDSSSPKAKPSPHGSIAHGRTAMESQARSTRLANRRTMTTEAEIPEEEFVSVDCPICGNHEKKIVEHLNTIHQEMELSVSRISNTAFRCLKCAISFGITDLVSHDTWACIRSKQFQHIKERKLQHPKGENKGEEKAPPSFITNNGISPPIPEGIGVSPIDTMENHELTSTDLIRKAMRCGVCGRINTKLGIIAECLKSHGIYRCALCFNSYSDKSTYSAHLRKVHTLDNGRLKCPLCEKAQFVNAGQVAGHMYNHHWESVFRKVFAEDEQNNLRLSEIKTEVPESVVIVKEEEDDEDSRDQVKDEEDACTHDSEIFDESDVKDEENGEGAHGIEDGGTKEPEPATESVSEENEESVSKESEEVKPEAKVDEDDDTTTAGEAENTETK